MMRSVLVTLLMIFSASTSADSNVVVVPLGGDVTNLLLEPSAIVSSGQWIVPASNTRTGVYTVPAGKTLVLTDIVFSSATTTAPLKLYKGNTVQSALAYMTLSVPACFWFLCRKEKLQCFFLNSLL